MANKVIKEGTLLWIEANIDGIISKLVGNDEGWDSEKMTSLIQQEQRSITEEVDRIRQIVTSLVNDDKHSEKYEEILSKLEDWKRVDISIVPSQPKNEILRIERSTPTLRQVGTKTAMPLTIDLLVTSTRYELWMGRELINFSQIYPSHNLSDFPGPVCFPKWYVLPNPSQQKQNKICFFYEPSLNLISTIRAFRDKFFSRKKYNPLIYIISNDNTLVSICEKNGFGVIKPENLAGDKNSLFEISIYPSNQIVA